jgi:hypothetical protein
MCWLGLEARSQAKPSKIGQAKLLAWLGLWPWLEIFKATGHGLSHGFGHMTEAKNILIKVLNYVTKLYISDFFLPFFWLNVQKTSLLVDIHHIVTNLTSQKDLSRCILMMSMNFPKICFCFRLLDMVDNDTDIEII